MRTSLRAPLLAVCMVGVLCSATTSEIRGYLVNRIDEGKKAVGIVVATIDPNGREVTAYGKRSNDGAAVDADSVFEIGSITKVFTSLLLADMVERGEVKMDTPVASLLPSTVTVPSRSGKQITLADLSMQVSGLPRMPNNFRPADPENPYADYDATKLYEFLSGHTLARDPGEKYDYSNIGVGLLGHALARKAGMSYEELLKKRIFDPLGMKDTSITLSPEQRKRLAIGHNPVLGSVKNWDLDALAGAGAIRSTANDMLKFLAANMELAPSPLQPAMRRMRSMSKPTGVPDLEIMMGWHAFKKYGTEIVWHNGGTGGYRSFAGFVPAAKRGVVVLCNTSMDNDDLGRHILESQWPVRKYEPAKVRTEITVDPKILDTYVGEYQLTPAFVIAVTRDGDALFVQATGQPKLRVYAEKPDAFFLKQVEAAVTFMKDESGKVTHLVLDQNGMQQKAARK
jgi:CubicO group peptidase (beta-lactamase class C family)